MNLRSSTLGPGAFRFFLAVTVVVNHSFPIRLGTWAVYVFFILSGYWITRMWEQKYLFTRMPIVTFLISRWWRVAPVFLFCTGLALWFGEVRPYGGTSAAWALRQVCIIGSVSAGILLPPAWSLDVEAQFYFLAPLLFWLGQRRLVYFPLAAALSFSCFTYIACLPLQPDHWQFRMGVIPYLGFFLSGVEIYRRSWVPSKHLARGSLLLFVICNFVLIALPVTRSGIWSPGVETADQWWRQLWSGVGALIMLPFIAHNLRNKSGRCDRFLGNWAYPLYLFHWFARNWYYRHVDWSQPLCEQAALLVLNLLAALIGSFLILILLDGPLDRLRACWVESRLKVTGKTSRGTVAPLVSWTGSSPS